MPVPEKMEAVYFSLYEGIKNSQSGGANFRLFRFAWKDNANDGLSSC
jgi:hypothetical protein